MSPEFQSLCYLAAWDAEQPLEGGLAWEAQLRRCRLDYSWASLARIDVFLDALRAQRKPQPDAFLAVQANVNLLLMLAFYVVEVRSRASGVRSRLLGFDEAVARDPAVQVHGRGFHSLLIAEQGTTRFLPLVAICDRLFEAEPDKSVAFSAGVFVKVPDDTRRRLEPLVAASMVPDFFARYQGKRIPDGYRRIHALQGGFEGFEAGDPLRRLERDAPLLLRRGRVVWAAVVQANRSLLDPSWPVTAAAEVVYDPDGRVTRDDLCRIAARLREAKDEYPDAEAGPETAAADPLPADATLAQYAAHLRAETTRVLGWRVPLYPYAVRASSILANGEVHLPGYALVEPALPVLVCDECPGSVIVAPWQMWPADVYDAWCERSRAVHGPKARIFPQPADGSAAADAAAAAAPRPRVTPEQVARWEGIAVTLLQQRADVPLIRRRLDAAGCPAERHGDVIAAAAALASNTGSGRASSPLAVKLAIFGVIALVLAASRYLMGLLR